MRASEGSETIPNAELDRHAEALSRLGVLARTTEMRRATCTLVLRSPSSAPAQALTAMKETLDGTRIDVRAILARLEPEQDLKTLCATLTAITSCADGSPLIRWARNPRLWDAHEQAAYGPNLCWSGDPIRRDANKRNPLAMFETTPDAASRAAHAFNALWKASAPVPARLLDGAASAKPAPSFDQDREDALTAIRPPAEGWPLVRH